MLKPSCRRVSAIFVHPTIETLNKIEKKRGSNLFKGKSLDEVYANLSDFFLKMGVVQEFTFEKVGACKYVLRVDGYMWARHIHEELKPEDVTCPFALLAMAVFEKVIGRKVKVADSRYFKEGTETIIEALPPLTFEVYDYDKMREKEAFPKAHGTAKP